MEDLLRKLDLDIRGTLVGGVYTINIDNYDEFSSIYIKLDKSEVVTKDSDNSSFTMDSASIKYYTEEYELTLTGDLSSDVYKLLISEEE